MILPVSVESAVRDGLCAQQMEAESVFWVELCSPAHAGMMVQCVSDVFCRLVALCGRMYMLSLRVR